MAKALNYSDPESDDQGETDVFGEIRKKDIEKFFARKLQAFLTGDAKFQKDQSTESQASNSVDLEKELLNFLDDFQTFKNSDEKSITSDDVSDSDSDSGSDETFTDGASVVIEDESGLSQQELDMIEMLTGSKKDEKENVEQKNLSLLDLGEDELNEELQKNHDFLLDFQSEVSKAEEKSSGRKNKVVKCYHCDGHFEIVGNYQKSLREHQKEKSHIEKSREKRNKNMSSAQSECSSVVDGANLPNYISTNNDKEYCCDVCHGKVIGKFRKQILTHMQSQEHANNIQTRFEKPKKEGNKKKEENADKIHAQPDKTKKEEKKPEGKDNTKKDSKKGDALAYALGLACIKPVTENQWQCTMCNKTIPVAKEYSNLMRNIAQHIQGDIHVKKLQELEGSLKDIKEKPDVQKAKKNLKENTYKFICLPCERDGYGYEFCKSHLASAAHNSKIYKLVESKTPANFRNGVKCGGCNKHIFGANVNINEHCTECIKKNGFNGGRRNRRRARRLQNERGPKQQNQRGPRPQNEKGPRHQNERGPRPQNERGPRPQNENGPRSSNNEGRGNPRKPHGQKPNQAYRFEKKPEQNIQPDIAGQIASMVTHKMAELIVGTPQGNQPQYQHPTANRPYYPPPIANHQLAHPPNSIQQPANNYQYQRNNSQQPANNYQPRAATASGVRDGFVYVDQAPARQRPPKKEKESCVIS